jgi:hypothetical protein
VVGPRCSELVVGGVNGDSFEEHARSCRSSSWSCGISMRTPQLARGSGLTAAEKMCCFRVAATSGSNGADLQPDVIDDRFGQALGDFVHEGASVLT